MSSYSDMANDQRQAQWLKQWVPESEEEYTTEHNLEIDWRQYRFTLARAREAEAKVKAHEGVFSQLARFLKDAPYA